MRVYLRQIRRTNKLRNSLLGLSFPQRNSERPKYISTMGSLSLPNSEFQIGYIELGRNEMHELKYDACHKGTFFDEKCSHRVVAACAMIFPPIGFDVGPNIAPPPSTAATTWLVTSTATLN